MEAKSSARRSAKQNKSKQNAKQHEANNTAKRSNLRSPTRATGRHNDKLVVVSCFAPRCLSFPFAACLDLLCISSLLASSFLPDLGPRSSLLNQSSLDGCVASWSPPIPRGIGYYPTQHVSVSKGIIWAPSRLIVARSDRTH